MQNDTLKNRIVPWQEKGRWYHLVHDTSSFVADKTDQFILDNFQTVTASGFFRFGQTAASHAIKPYQIIDVKYVASDDVTFTANATITTTTYVGADGRILYPLCPISITGEFECWVFIR